MPLIHILDEPTINQIAAGEVVERPSAVVKELIENAMDAGATAITAEIKEGGLSLIRVTDNGAGIAKEDIPLAFLRHATSKIKTAQDLLTVKSLGFRGEALSSIAAVAQVELITKTADSINGYRYIIEGGEEKSLEEIGCPGGTTILVRNIFYNTPARRKFLKSAITEAGYVSDLMERLIVSHPGISFKFIMNNQVKLQSSGNNSCKDILYHIYGRDISKELIPVEYHGEEVSLSGFIGKPVINRGNRNFENYFINGRYIKSNVITKAIEEAYKPFLMQHKYPFTSLYFEIEPDLIDVNVHPQKLEIRLKTGEEIYHLTYNLLRNSLSGKELIPKVTLSKQEEKQIRENNYPEPFEQNRRKQLEALGILSSANEVGKNLSRDKDISSLSGKDISGNKDISSLSGKDISGNKDISSLGGKDISGNKDISSLGGKDISGDRDIASSVNNDISASEGKEIPASSLNINRANTGNLYVIDNSVIPGLKNPSGTASGNNAEAYFNNPDSSNKGYSNNPDFYKFNNKFRNSKETDRNPDTSTNSDINTKGISIVNNPDQTNSNILNEESAYTVPGPERSNNITDNAAANKEGQALEQLNLFAESDNSGNTPFLSATALEEHRIIGQVFSTYWLVEYRKELYIIDQHAAHEKVLYERIMAAARDKTYESQLLMPPIVLTLTLHEQKILELYKDTLNRLGYEIEPFGGNEYSIRAVPADLYGLSEKELLLEFIDELAEDISGNTPRSESILERIASLSCKAAVKANHTFSYDEAAALIKELLTLKNPYNCPHGRPVIISMSQYELEKKFKRVL